MSKRGQRGRLTNAAIVAELRAHVQLTLSKKAARYSTDFDTLLPAQRKAFRKKVRRTSLPRPRRARSRRIPTRRRSTPNANVLPHRTPKGRGGPIRARSSSGAGAPTRGPSHGQVRPNRRLVCRYVPGAQAAMRIFHTRAGHGSQAFLAIGSALFELEKILREHPVEQVEIGLVGRSPGEDGLVAIAAALRELVQYTLLADVEFVFRQVPGPPVRQIRTSFDLTPTRDVCLFSGGLDSFVGLWLSLERLGPLDAVFCAHSDQSWIIRVANRLHRKVFKGRGVRLRQVYVPPISKEGYAQLRGFLYLLSAAAWMQIIGAERLIVTEVGPTMHQPKFDPFDIVTLTTHPYVVATAQTVITGLLGREVQVVLPFADMTKAEVAALAPEQYGIRATHSCISQRFGTHDGTCYGCVVRRLATVAAGVKDVTYRRDPIADPSASRENLLALLRFSLDYLSRRDTMEEYEIGDIIRFQRQDLFRRFALDNLAALHRLVLEKRRLAPDVTGLYRVGLTDLGGPAKLEERLAVLRAKAVTPTF